jgi:hypothetical protein
MYRYYICKCLASILELVVAWSRQVHEAAQQGEEGGEGGVAGGQLQLGVLRDSTFPWIHLVIRMVLGMAIMVLGMAFMVLDMDITVVFEITSL